MKKQAKELSKGDIIPTTNTRAKMVEEPINSVRSK